MLCLNMDYIQVQKQERHEELIKLQEKCREISDKMEEARNVITGKQLDLESELSVVKTLTKHNTHTYTRTYIQNTNKTITYSSFFSGDEQIDK